MFIFAILGSGVGVVLAYRFVTDLMHQIPASNADFDFSLVGEPSSPTTDGSFWRLDALESDASSAPRREPIADLV